jgi:hypothetical protein
MVSDVAKILGTSWERMQDSGCNDKANKLVCCYAFRHGLGPHLPSMNIPKVLHLRFSQFHDYL